MRLKPNPEYVRRHLFAAAVVLGLALWFGYDGLVRYPAQSAHELYVAIEKAEPAANFDLASFKTQKIRSQLYFAWFLLGAFALIGADLWLKTRLKLEWDEAGFAVNGQHFGYVEVSGLDEAAWEKQCIVTLVLSGGRRVRLDAWHYAGVNEFRNKVKETLGK